jgi:hypothetical protein
MTDPLSLNPKDEELLSEIVLLTDLMIAANEADGRVPPDTLDVILSDGHPAREPRALLSVPRQRTSRGADGRRDPRSRRLRAPNQDRAPSDGRFAAMGIRSGPDVVGHAVADGSPVSVCGMEVLIMVGVADDFSSLPADRQCTHCSALADGR